MTNEEYIKSHGTCINTGQLGMIEAYIRMQCMVKGIEFDDDKIKSWLKQFDPVPTLITSREILEKTIGTEYTGPYDGLIGFDFTIDPISRMMGELT